MSRSRGVGLKQPLFFRGFQSVLKGSESLNYFKCINRKFGNPSHEERVSVLAKNKTEGLDLTNHMTGWNCLCKLWDGDENIKTQLQHMGYGPNNGPLDFSRREFDIDNGSKGKMPTLLKEWVSVGIRENKLKT